MPPNPSSGRQTGGLSALKVSSVPPRALCCHGDRTTPTFGFAKQLDWARSVSSTLNRKPCRFIRDPFQTRN